ncbi:EAL domain-containing protein [Aurantimonas sp. VKM B-3413]|uniref:EAL domain-containing protein n=1 Tax=Aurantimonas sp. VKM B-3413 TaxID=2779401 RepID=UPI001E548B60|nr:EAL domain-containing protein [Aurantimonas sp. VKM B-3413]MCB8838297.1 EAL domain-containing protein [Aurantimonas sp. VKM B-3413]
MAKLVSLFISSRQQTIISLLLGCLLFAGFVGFAALFAVQQIHHTMRSEAQEALQPVIDVGVKIDEAFSALEKGVTAAPCSQPFLDQMRRVAYLPDGISEFLYAPDGRVKCSLSKGWSSQALDLGPPDTVETAEAPANRFDRDLAFLGLDGLVGSLVSRGPFALVVPKAQLSYLGTSWLAVELVAVSQSGVWRHRGGREGVHSQFVEAAGGGLSGLLPRLSESRCTANGRFCVTTEASFLGYLKDQKVGAVVALLVAAVLAIALADRGRAMIVRHWSFEKRFRRHLGPESVICMYQPIMELRTGRISACEVLARWRDVDDQIVYPDRFIPLVERYGLTMSFTRMVVERAYADLSAKVPDGHKLLVTFNIFPRDLDSKVLCDVFRPFLSEPDRFTVVVELVESDAVVVEWAQREIELLRQAGIQTFIDDFGAGYSSIHNLAALSVDGVKLDRSFAMAPADSLMARMLGHAIEMIHASARSIVVEGVETRERLDQLRSVEPPIDYVQGYFISRPLTPPAFREFLLKHPADPARLSIAA